MDGGLLLFPFNTEIDWERFLFEKVSNMIMG